MHDCIVAFDDLRDTVEIAEFAGHDFLVVAHGLHLDPVGDAQRLRQRFETFAQYAARLPPAPVINSRLKRGIVCPPEKVPVL